MQFICTRRNREKFLGEHKLYIIKAAPPSLLHDLILKCTFCRTKSFFREPPTLFQLQFYIIPKIFTDPYRKLEILAAEERCKMKDEIPKFSNVRRNIKNNFVFVDVLQAAWETLLCRPEPTWIFSQQYYSWKSLFEHSKGFLYFCAEPHTIAQHLISVQFDEIHQPWLSVQRFG